MSQQTVSDWQACHDPKTNHPYWYNSKTGMSQWEKPDELKAQEALQPRSPPPPSYDNRGRGEMPASGGPASGYHNPYPAVGSDYEQRGIGAPYSRPGPAAAGAASGATGPGYYEPDPYQNRGPVGGYSAPRLGGYEEDRFGAGYRGDRGAGPPAGVDPNYPPRERRLGDWNCPSCQNYNFAKRFECNKCHTQKPPEAEVGDYQAGGGGGGPDRGYRSSDRGGGDSRGGRFTPYSGGGGGGGGGGYPPREIPRDSIIIFGLPLGITAEEVAEKFKSAGTVATDRYSGRPIVTIFVDNDGNPKGEGTVRFEDERSANQAVEWMHGKDLFDTGKTVRVELKRPSRFGPGGYHRGRGDYGGNRGGDDRGGYHHYNDSRRGYRDDDRGYGSRGGGRGGYDRGGYDRGGYDRNSGGRGGYDRSSDRGTDRADYNRDDRGPRRYRDDDYGAGASAGSRSGAGGAGGAGSEVGRTADWPESAGSAMGTIGVVAPSGGVGAQGSQSASNVDGLGSGRGAGVTGSS